MVRFDISIAFSLCLCVSISGFSVRPQRAMAPAFAVKARCPTRLFADDADENETPPAAEEDEEKADADHVLPSESGSDILNSPAFLKRKLDVLKSDLANADNELEELKERVAAGKAEWGAQLDDLQVEYKKIQERMTEQNEGGNDEATVLVARQMLGLLDNYDRAFGVLTAETEEQKEIEDAYKATYVKILETFESLGVKEVETVGKEFDYEVHQAVMQRPSDEYDEGIVCEELAKGFVLGDTLIRAAMVSVAA